MNIREIMGVLGMCLLLMALMGFGVEDVDAAKTFTCPARSALPGGKILMTSTGDLRNAKTVRDFKKAFPCPSTGSSSGACPGWVMDHIKPLKCNGKDVISNAQWQTTKEGRAKDCWEIYGDATHVPCSGLAK